MPSALEHIHTAGERLGEYGTGVTSLLGSTTSLVYDTLANTNLPASYLGEMAVLIESGNCAGEIGWIKGEGLTRSSGAIATADTFHAAIEAGVRFSLYGRLPPYREGKKPGLLELINQAHQSENAEDTLSIAGVTSQIHYTIDTAVWPWFTDDTRIIDVQYPTTAADDVPTILPRTSWEWISDGEVRKLRFPGAPFLTGETWTIKVNRPANSRLKLNATGRSVLSTTTVGSVTVIAGGYYTSAPAITFSGGGGTGAAATAVLATTPGPVTSVTITNNGTGYTTPPTVSIAAGAWSDQTTQTAGLVTLSDESIPDVRFIRTKTLALAYDALSTLGAPGQTKAEWQAMAAQWTARSNRQRANRPQDAHQGVVRLNPVAIGGSQSLSKTRWY